MKPIFEYLDYRKYLADAIKDRKGINRHFSFRFISQHLNLKSTAFMHRVVTGEKKLPESLVPKIAMLFKLDIAETEYFLADRNFLFSGYSKLLNNFALHTP